MRKPYLICDGVLTLSLQPADGGWYAVTSPMDPQLVTQAKSIEEAFDMAYDARKSLADARRKLARRLTLLESSAQSSPVKKTAKTRSPRRRAKPGLKGS